ncbi:hypothetical protein fnug_324 [Pseudomonas phage fnug]|uniref:PHIKZ276 n=5 Tax=Viruses TaxID=10239 RepID=Q8SCN6_BPDPK|nr:PHIKZ276 [Pseudomonas phage phiKZ]YP_009619587.1 hypothetical protein FDJ06_gp047 [Pseudomonas phage SL2]ANM45091.1 hypothetical protein KTN4_333 [Pseudomonas phage KTN4]QJB22967.1 hypothetical protein fnug_324 [Pseudomonas phage fnug]USL86550.1 hypothetical protein CDGHABPJ_00086 [Pseudomonas phage OMKO1]UXD83305.1 hypothetical protein NP274_00253 [Pseudomonas phage Koomba boorn-mokiny kep-wari Wadjak 1]WNV47997.1 hypothetical protein [Pseudomonas phage fMGyn-Pae01]WNV49925.1 hypothetica
MALICGYGENAVLFGGDVDVVDYAMSQRKYTLDNKFIIRGIAVMSADKKARHSFCRANSELFLSHRTKDYNVITQQFQESVNNYKVMVYIVFDDELAVFVPNTPITVLNYKNNPDGVTVINKGFRYKQRERLKVLIKTYHDDLLLLAKNIADNSLKDVNQLTVFKDGTTQRFI